MVYHWVWVWLRTLSLTIIISCLDCYNATLIWVQIRVLSLHFQVPCLDEVINYSLACNEWGIFMLSSECLWRASLFQVQCLKYVMTFITISVFRSSFFWTYMTTHFLSGNSFYPLFFSIMAPQITRFCYDIVSAGVFYPSWWSIPIQLGCHLHYHDFSITLEYHPHCHVFCRKSMTKQSQAALDAVAKSAASKGINPWQVDFVEVATVWDEMMSVQSQLWSRNETWRLDVEIMEVLSIFFLLSHGSSKFFIHSQVLAGFYSQILAACG